MTTDDGDDAALAWAGDEKPVAPAAKPVAPAAKPVVELVETPSAAKPQIPAALLVTYGILAGAYLLYTVGWFFSVQRFNATHVVSPEALNAFMFGLGEVLAVASPALWFASSFVLLRGRRPIFRLLALVIGLVAVLPWPFVLGAWQS